MLRFYLDEDAMEQAVVDGLRLLGIGLTTVTEARMRGRTDAEQLAFATEGGMVLVSFNVGDYMRLHGELMRGGQHHTGMVLSIQRRFGIGELQRRLARIATTLDPNDMVNRVEFLNAWG